MGANDEHEARGARTPLLSVRGLAVSVDDKEILRGLDLAVRAGEVHAIMGPNGSGKSTLAQVLAGREAFTVTGGEVRYDGRDLLALPPEERAREGVFLAFQYPVEIPGVNNAYLLKAALNAIRSARSSSSRTTSACSTTSCRTSSTCWSTAASSRAATGPSR